MRQPSLYLRQQWHTGTAGAGVLAVAGLVVLAFMFWHHDPAPPGSGPYSAAQDAEYRLSQESVVLSGTRERLFVLERWKTDAGQPSGASVNLLIVDSEDASSQWMFPDNGQTILSRDELRTTDGAFSPVSGVVLTVSNTGGEKQRESLYYHRVGGGPAVRFLTADAIVSADQTSPDRYLVIYRNGTRTTAAVYSLVDFRVLAEKAAPDVPQ